MPIEIRELIIKATVQQDGQSIAAGAGASGNNGVKPNEELINSCIEKIIESIKERNER